MFSKRHYDKIAAIIATMPLSIRHAVAVHFAVGLQDTNFLFDKSRFIEACEPKGKTDAKT